MMLVEYEVKPEQQFQSKTSEQHWPVLAQQCYANLQPRQRPGWAAIFLQHTYDWLGADYSEIEDLLRIATQPQAGYWFHTTEINFYPDSYINADSYAALPLFNLARTVRDITYNSYVAVVSDIFYLPSSNQLDFNTLSLGQRLGQDLTQLAAQQDSRFFNKQISSLLLTS